MLAIDYPNEKLYIYEKLLQRITVPPEKRHEKIKFSMTIHRKNDSGKGCLDKGSLVYWWDQDLNKIRYQFLKKKKANKFLEICELTLQNRSKISDPIIFTGFQATDIVYSIQLFWNPGENITIGITRFDENGLCRKYYHFCNTPLDLDRY